MAEQIHNSLGINIGICLPYIHYKTKKLVTVPILVSHFDYLFLR